MRPKNHIISFALLVFMVLFGTPVHSQDTIPDKEAIGRALYDFGGISGGWILNERCKKLGRAERREFEWTYYRINTLMQTELGSNVVRQIQKAAIEVAKSEKHQSCGQETATLISQALASIRRMNAALTNSPYNAKSSYKEYAANQFLQIEVGIRVNTTCKHIPSDVISQVKKAKQELLVFTISVVGIRHMNRLLSTAESISQRPAFKTCGPETQKIANFSSLLLRETIVSIRHDNSLIK